MSEEKLSPEALEMLAQIFGSDSQMTLTVRAIPVILEIREWIVDKLKELEAKESKCRRHFVASPKNSIID